MRHRTIANLTLCNTDSPYNVKVEPRSNNATARGPGFVLATDVPWISCDTSPG